MGARKTPPALTQHVNTSSEEGNRTQECPQTPLPRWVRLRPPGPARTRPGLPASWNLRRPSPPLLLGLQEVLTVSSTVAHRPHGLSPLSLIPLPLLSSDCACSVAKSCLTLCDPRGCSLARLLCLWDFPGKNTGVGCYFPLQGIFLTQGWNPHLLCLWHWQADSLQLSC